MPKFFIQLSVSGAQDTHSGVFLFYRRRPQIHIHGISARQLVAYLTAGTTFIFAPRRYLKSIATDSPGEVIARVGTLAVSFAALELALFWGTLLPHTIVSLGLFETLLGLAVVPIFYIVVRTFSGAHPLRVAIVYVLTIRFTVMVPAVVFYALFVLTEDYTFAFLRGLATAGYLIILLCLLPLAFFDRVRDRVLALLLVMVAYIGYSAFLGVVTSRFGQAGERVTTLSLLYDPIGAEVDRLVTNGDIREQLRREPSEFVAATRLAASGQPDSTSQSLLYRRDSMDILAARWQSHSNHTTEHWQRLDKGIQSTIENARFSTTRSLLVAQRRHLSAMRDYGNLLDLYAASPKAELHLKFFDAHLKVLRSSTAFQQEWAEHLSIRLRLLNLGLVDPPSVKRQSDSTSLSDA